MAQDGAVTMVGSEERGEGGGEDDEEVEVVGVNLAGGSAASTQSGAEGAGDDGDEGSDDSDSDDDASSWTSEVRGDVVQARALSAFAA